MPNSYFATRSSSFFLKVQIIADVAGREERGSAWKPICRVPDLSYKAIKIGMCLLQALLNLTFRISGSFVWRSRTETVDEGNRHIEAPSDTYKWDSAEEQAKELPISLL
jgi:hypothetical protein